MFKKASPLSVALVSALITAIICLSIGLSLVESNQPHSVGDIVTEKVEVDAETTIATGETSEANNGTTNTRTATFVYLGACSKLYKSENATVSCGIFLDTFENIKLAELIDSAGFPYKQEYVAVTSSSNPVRYMIKTVSGSTYWVEP